MHLLKEPPMNKHPNPIYTHTQTNTNTHPHPNNPTPPPNRSALLQWLHNYWLSPQASWWQRGDRGEIKNGWGRAKRERAKDQRRASERGVRLTWWRNDWSCEMEEDTRRRLWFQPIFFPLPCCGRVGENCCRSDAPASCRLIVQQPSAALNTDGLPSNAWPVHVWGVGGAAPQIVSSEHPLIWTQPPGIIHASNGHMTMQASSSEVVTANLFITFSRMPTTEKTRLTCAASWRVSCVYWILFWQHCQFVWRVSDGYRLLGVKLMPAVVKNRGRKINTSDMNDSNWPRVRSSWINWGGRLSRLARRGNCERLRFSGRKALVFLM